MLKYYYNVQSQSMYVYIEKGKELQKDFLKLQLSIMKYPEHGILSYQ